MGKNQCTFLRLSILVRLVGLDAAFLALFMSWRAVTGDWSGRNQINCSRFILCHVDVTSAIVDVPSIIENFVY